MDMSGFFLKAVWVLWRDTQKERDAENKNYFTNISQTSSVCTWIKLIYQLLSLDQIFNRTLA